MMRRWHHGHSTLTGVVIGVLLVRHAWLLFLTGVAVGFAVAYVRQTAAWFADKLRHWREYGPSRPAVIRDGPAPVYRVPRKHPDDTIPF